jgi:uncharacterized protein YgiM (DUF1202 family)
MKTKESNMRKLKLIGVQIFALICLTLFAPVNLYESNAVEKKLSSVSYVELDSRRLLKEVDEIKVASQKQIEKRDVLNKQYTSITIPCIYEEEIQSFSTETNKTKETKNDTEYYWTTDRVNLREEPNTNSSIIETLHKNERVRVYKDCGEWIEVIHNGNTGYLSKDYLKDKKSKSIEVTKEELKMLQRITEAECPESSINK